MKKVILTAMLFAMSIYSFAENNNASAIEKTAIETNIKKYEMKVNNRRLGCVLGATLDQMESMENVIRELDESMAFASSMATEESQNAIIANAVKNNLKYMHYILNENQYKKYVMLLNLTLMNKGFDMTKISK